MYGYRVAAASTAVAAALAAVAFVAGAGLELERATTVEIALIVAGGTVVVLWGLHGGLDELVSTRRPIPGMGVLGLFGGFVALTAASGSWSISPDATFTETARLLAYLAAFAIAVIAGRRFRDAATVLAWGLLIAGAAVCLWALITRVFPASLASFVVGPRLQPPLGYWNALGGFAAMCVPVALWAGARRDGGKLTTAAALPLLSLSLLVLLLTQSRGALGGAVLGTLLWLALVPLRLRSAAVLATAAACALPVAIWALSKDGFSEVLAPLADREAIAAPLALLTATMLAVSFALGLVLRRPPRRLVLSPRGRTRAGCIAIAIACVVPIGGVAKVALSDAGIGGTVSSNVSKLTSEDAGATPQGTARFGSVSSARGQYWRQAARVFADNVWVGTGANSFTLARLRYRKDRNPTEHAHGFPAQTLSDLGLAGISIALALLVAWIVAATRSLRRPPRDDAPPWSSQRTALCALAASVVTFGVQSAVDWTWFVPAVGVAALACAGVVASARPSAGPFRAREGRGRAWGLLPVRRPSGETLAGTALIGVAAILCAWAAWLPLASSRATDKVYELLEAKQLGAANRQADRARETDPYSTDPVYAKAAVLSAQGRPIAAYSALEQAAIEHPLDPETWLRLGRFELEDLDLPQRTLETMGGAFRADPNSRAAIELSRRAQAER